MNFLRAFLQRLIGRTLQTLVRKTLETTFQQQLRPARVRRQMPESPRTLDGEYRRLPDSSNRW